MGMPEIFINFKAKSANFIRQGNQGVICVLVKEAKDSATHCVSELEIPTSLTEENQEFCKSAFKGGYNRPSKVIIVGYTDVAKLGVTLKTFKFNYACTNVAEDTEAISIIIKNMRDIDKIQVKAVLYNCDSNHEGVINFADDTKGIEYTSRIASILATTPLDKSSTYFELSDLDLTDIPMLSKSDMDKKVDDGELFIVNDGYKCKLSRAVNSLTTTSDDKTEDFKSIKIIDIMDKISTDLKTTVTNNYIGIGNSYSNKMNVIVAIRQYLEDLKSQGIVGNYNVDIDLDAQIKYIKTLGAKIEEMTDMEIKKYNTKKKVFTVINIQLLDAMEDFYFSINLM